jgi:hypothetical protein
VAAGHREEPAGIAGVLQVLSRTSAVNRSAQQAYSTGWFYVSGLAILADAEVNAEIEHTSPHGKTSGQNNEHRKRLTGAHAARAFRQCGPDTP